MSSSTDRCARHATNHSRRSHSRQNRRASRQPARSAYEPRSAVVVPPTRHAEFGGRHHRMHSLFDRAIVFNVGSASISPAACCSARSFGEPERDRPSALSQSSAIATRVLLGGKPGVAVNRAAAGAPAPQHDFVGTCHGYYEQRDCCASSLRSKRAAPTPCSSPWAIPNRKPGSTTISSTPAAVRLRRRQLSTSRRRARPGLGQGARLEWAYRLLQEPARLWHRYLIQMPLFLLRVSRQWFTGARVPNVIPQ